MSADRILAWLPLVTLTAMLLAARLRALRMQRRGLRVIIVDWQRPRFEIVYDTLLIVVFMFWFYLLVAEAWPLSLAWLPELLARKIVNALPMRFFGAILVLAAPILFAAALAAMSTSWRMGIDRQQPGPLVTTGLFAWTRNPIYTAFGLVIIGTFLIHGRAIFLLLGAVLLGFVHGVVRREERFLAERFGDAFGAYCSRVGRYSPWV